ncbi:unnamed protein product [Polarella glacialis]|uniref:non-specific serine/threonine protein kinase n=1 Tax=Polarella glacialis TaxID=89957 RepID=A0A813J7J6_POLGL|nr:unnamed protein product [Polarella glacialis]
MEGQRCLDANLPSNRYRKLRQIGQGAFGKAYLVEDLRHGLEADGLQQFVLKKIPLNRAEPGKGEAAFQEALLLRRISRGCPFIVGFKEVFVGAKGSNLCLVMEFAAGGDLKQTLSARDGARPSEAEVLEWVVQVCAALAHCHAMGALHRDVKPENCFLSSEGRLMLGDFGIAVALDERTHAQTCCGTPHYISPEVMNGEPYGPSCDVWSLGILAYEAAALRKPFPGFNICQLAMQICCAEPRPLDDGNSEPTISYSPEFRVLLDRLLVKDPAKRATAREALQMPFLDASARATCSKLGVPWTDGVVPPGHQRRGLVERVRQERLQAEDSPPQAEEATWNEDYPDDFEEVSEDEYAPDFENLSDDEVELPTAQEAREATKSTLAQQVGEFRQQLSSRAESGAAEPELVGVLDFLEEMVAQAA